MPGTRYLILQTVGPQRLHHFMRIFSSNIHPRLESGKLTQRTTRTMMSVSQETRTSRSFRPTERQYVSIKLRLTKKRRDAEDDRRVGMGLIPTGLASPELEIETNSLLQVCLAGSSRERTKANLIHTRYCHATPTLGESSPLRKTTQTKWYVGCSKLSD